MLKFTFTTFLFLILNHPMAFSQDEGPQFDAGPGESQFKWGVKIPISEGQTDLKVRVGARLQALMENGSNTAVGGRKSSDNQDLYIRRSRFQFQAKMLESLLFYMDVRAIKSIKAITELTVLPLVMALCRFEMLLAASI